MKAPYLVDVSVPTHKRSNTCTNSCTPNHQDNQPHLGHGCPGVGLLADVLDDPGPVHGDAGERPNSRHGGYYGHNAICLRQDVLLL